MMKIYKNSELKIVTGILDAINIKHTITEDYDFSGFKYFDVTLDIILSTTHREMIEDLCSRAIMTHNVVHKNGGNTK